MKVFKPVTAKLATRSFFIPSILVSFAILVVEGFLSGVFNPSHSSFIKNIVEVVLAIIICLSLGYSDLRMLNFLYRLHKGTYRRDDEIKKSINAITFCCLFFVGGEAYVFLQSSLRNWSGWILVIYFIYGVYIAIGLYRKHLVPSAFKSSI